MGWSLCARALQRGTDVYQIGISLLLRSSYDGSILWIVDTFCVIILHAGTVWWGTKKLA